MPPPLPYLPDLIAHADWGSNPAKRWMAFARRQGSGAYAAGLPGPVGDPDSLLSRLRQAAGPDGAVLLGFDFPIGIPWRYAQRCAVGDFLALLPQLGEGEWADFYNVAERPEQIHLRRPFYPLRPGAALRLHLLDALGMERMDDLRRQCELPHPGRRAAAPLFWTLGGQQVGKAAICGWREVLAPAIRANGLPGSSPSTRFWPFSGALIDLLQPGSTVIAETYPAEFYRHLGVRFPYPLENKALTAQHSNVQPSTLNVSPPFRRPRTGKRSPAARAANGPALLEWAARAGLVLSPPLQDGIEQGFGPSPGGEDPFDALVGLFGMLAVVLGLLPPGEPSDQRIRKVEGWILGQPDREEGNPDFSPAR